MPRIEIYTTPYCGHCQAAKRLLQKKGLAYEETDVSADHALRAAMTDRAGGRQSVPQIFIDGRHVGGADELYGLDREGRLDPLLSA